MTPARVPRVRATPTCPFVQPRSAR
jgi:hypothetical protein